MKLSFAGYYKFIVIDAETGIVKQETSLEKNLITNIGLDRMGTANDYCAICHVGSGSAVPAVTDTGLQSPISYSSNTETVQGYDSSGSPAYGFLRRTFTFNAGTATGNLSEVSVGWLTGPGGAFSRSLIRDNGVPITLTVSATDILQVVYELRSYINTADATFNCVIAGVTHSCVARPSSADSTSYWAFWGGGTEQFGVNVYNPEAYETDVLGAAIGQPAGTPSNGSHTPVAYVNGTYQRDFHNDFGLSLGNFASGIGSMTFRLSTGHWQVSFSPKIQKTSSKTLRVTARISWGRA